MQDGTIGSSGRMAAGFMAGITEALVIVTPFEVRCSPGCELFKRALDFIRG